MLIALVLGSDSFVASAALAPALPSSKVRIRLVSLFAICDGVATGIATLSPWHGPWIGALGPGWLAITACYLAATSALGRRPPSTRSVYLLPVLLSIDNLVGPGLAGAGAWSAVGAGIGAAIGSGAMSLAGLTLGAVATAALHRLAVSAPWLPHVRVHTATCGLILGALVLVLA